MKHTEYLFGEPRSHYEPCITELATRRIQDGKLLLKKLSKLKATVNSVEELDELVVRYQSTEKAIKHWVDILGEE